MGLFKRSAAQPQAMGAQAAQSTGYAYNVPDLGAEIRRQLQAARSRVFTYSDYVKQVDCLRCGAPKRLPSKTAYLYCDHCGTLVDYDFRAANFGTSAALTNQVFAFLMAPVKTEAERAIVLRDAGRYRELVRPVYLEWLRQCPMAASPRSTSDEDFRRRATDFWVESMVVREFTPELRAIEDRLQAATNGVRRYPQPNGGELIDDSIWPVARLFKQLTDESYRLAQQHGVLDLEPEGTPVAVQIRMEYSFWCQNWLPKLPPGTASQILAFFGVRNDYAKAAAVDAQPRKCGGCGDELRTVPGAQAVVCESCGRMLDIAGGEVPCQSCGAPLSFPVSVTALECPYCHTGTRRV